MFMVATFPAFVFALLTGGAAGVALATSEPHAAVLAAICGVLLMLCGTGRPLEDVS